MDTETQNTNISDGSDTVKVGKAVSAKHHLIYGLIYLIVLIVGMGSVYLWQHHKVNDLNNQLNDYQTTMIKDSKISLDNVNAVIALPNTVVDTASSPTDLIAFLGADNTQCYKANENGYFKVISQVNDQFAKMQYGCSAKNSTTPLGTSPAYILAKKTDGKWSLISPTNQWLPINGQDVPSCIMVNTNKVSKLITPQCWQGVVLNSSDSFNPNDVTVMPVTN
jgi:hypothetical protein